jgi:hypothetical protein
MVQPAMVHGIRTVVDTEGNLWLMDLNAPDPYSVVRGLKLLCQDAPMDIPEAWASEKAALVLLGFVIFELNPQHAWVFEKLPMVPDTQ